MVIYELRQSFAFVSLNRPELNSLSSESLSQLSETFKQLERNRTIRAVILAGSEKVFGAGTDTAYIRS